MKGDRQPGSAFGPARTEPNRRSTRANAEDQAGALWNRPVGRSNLTKERARGAPTDERQGCSGDCGSIYVEFVIAIVPLLAIFWGLMQLNGILLADLVTRHAAVNAVRAAIVCDSQKGKVQDGATLAGPGGCSYEAAKMTLSAVRSFQDPPDFSVEVQGAEETGNEPVTATVTARYHCQVPLAAAFVCSGILGGNGGVSASTLSLSRKATLPNQGASYKLD